MEKRLAIRTYWPDKKYTFKEVVENLKTQIGLAYGVPRYQPGKANEYGQGKALQADGRTICMDTLLCENKKGLS